MKSEQAKIVKKMVNAIQGRSDRYLVSWCGFQGSCLKDEGHKGYNVVTL